MRKQVILFTLFFFVFQKLQAQTPLFSHDVSNAFLSFYANQSSLYDQQSAVVDRDGNINFITSYSGLAVAKYNPSGQLLHQILLQKIVSTFVPPNIYKAFLLMDRQNNYYVFGNSKDYHKLKLQKLDPDGSLAWSRIFGSDTVEARDAVVTQDSRENIYVSGNYHSFNGPILSGFIAKLNTDGRIFWSLNLTIAPSGMVTDAEGNLYTFGSGFVITKYDTSGKLIWSTTSDNSYASDVKIAPSGNIYACGWTGISGDNDINTRKYDADGNQLWAKTYSKKNSGSEGNRILVDNDENVYVAGTVNGDGTKGNDLIEISYNKNGNQKWATVDTFGGPYFLNETVAGLIFDAYGNSLLLGTAFDTLPATSQYRRELLLQINSDGKIISSQLYHTGEKYDETPYFIIKDSSQNVYTLGAGLDTFNNVGATYILKRDPDLHVLYQQFYQVPLDKQEYHKSALTDQAGNFYSSNTIRYDDSYGFIRNLYRYNAAGNLQFINNFFPHTINRTVLDRQNNILICGLTERDGADIVVCDDSGKTKWEKTFLPALSQYATAVDISSDSKGNIYTTGKFQNSDALFSIFLSKYDSSGNLIWTHNYDSLESDEPYAMSIDDADNIFVCGRILNNNTYNPLLLKYDSDGNLIWSSIPPSVNGASDFAYSVLADNTGGCLVTGRYTQSKASRQGSMVSKISSGGATVWIRYRQGSEQSATDFGTHLKTDNKGNIFAEGRVMKDGLPYGISIIKYNKKGNQLWSYERSGYNFAFDDSVGVDVSYNDPLQFSVDLSGNIYVENVVDNTYAVEVIKLNSNGEQQWIYTSPMDQPKIQPSPNILTDDQGNIWSLFNVYNDSISKYDWRILKFNGSSFPQIFEHAASVQQELHVSIKIYPDPAIDLLKLSYENMENGKVILMIRNALGQVVYHTSIQNQPGDFNYEIPVASLQNGIYFLEAISKNNHSILQFAKE